MNKFASFLFGILFSVLIFGGLAAWLFLRAPDQGPAGTPDAPTSIQTPVAKKEDVTVIKTEAGPKLSDQDRAALSADPDFGIFFSGRVELPPLMASQIGKDATGPVRITIREVTGSNPGPYVLTQDFPNVKFPFSYSVPLKRGDLARYIGKEKIGPFVVSAYFCYRAGNTNVGCERGTLPRLGGFVEVTIPTPGGLRTRANLPVPPMFMNKKYVAPNPTECVKNGMRVMGQVVASQSFATEKKLKGKVAVVYVPVGTMLPPPPYAGNGARAITKQELDLAVTKHGVNYQVIQMEGTKPAPFSVGYSPGFEYNFGYHFAVLCKPSEQDGDCAARAFPFASFSMNVFPDRDVYKLIAKGWNSPTCGNKDVTYYLHNFSPNLVSVATPEAYLKANPPELVDGMSW